MKKVEKITTRPFRYDLNQIFYEYTVEVMNRFKGLDLVSRVPEELLDRHSYQWRGGGDQNLPKKKKCKEAEWLSEEALKISEGRRQVKSKGKGKRYSQLNAEFQRITWREKKPFVNEQCKEIEENNRTGKTWDLFNKTGGIKVSIKLEVSCKDWHEKW